MGFCEFRKMMLVVSGKLSSLQIKITKAVQWKYYLPKKRQFNGREKKLAHLMCIKNEQFKKGDSEQDLKSVEI